MPQIYDMGPTALLRLRRKACWGFFFALKIRRLRPGLNPRTWVLKASTLPLDHRSRLYTFVYKINIVLLTDVYYLFVCCNTSRWKTSKVERILTRSIERNIEDLLWISLGLYGGRGTRDASGLLKIFVLLHKMTAGISAYKLDQSNADPRGNR